MNIVVRPLIRSKEMMKMIEFLCNFDSGWLIASGIAIIGLLIAWKLIMNEFKSSTDKLGRGILLIVYLFLWICDKVLFYEALKRQPQFYFGFYGSVLIPTILFYLSLVAIIVFFLRSLTYGFFTSMSLLKFIPGGYAISAAQFAYAMAHGCPSCMFLAFVSFATVAWKGLAIPMNDEQKQKTE